MCEPADEHRGENQRHRVDISVANHERPERKIIVQCDCSADCNLTATKIGAYKRRILQTFHPQRLSRALFGGNLSYLIRYMFLPELPLNGFHLILEAEFQLFEPDFFQLFVVGEIAFLSEC